MIFSGTTFIFYFLPLLLILYYILPEKFQNTILIIFSLFFYIYGDVKFLPLLFDGEIKTEILKNTKNLEKEVEKLEINLF